MYNKSRTALPAAIAFDPAVSPMNPGNSISRCYRLPRWSQVKRHIAEWRIRACSRNELAILSDRTLRDIGLSRSDAMFEASKPFWMA
jgi:uncharacterized protein YjiS (DUF1127 family)